MSLKDIVIFVCLNTSLLILSAFGVFSGIHYCKGNDEMAERIFLITLGVIGFMVLVLVDICLINIFINGG